ncbi:hypothetical protein AAZX31_15G206300 [Glycine max]
MLFLIYFMSILPWKCVLIYLLSFLAIYCVGMFFFIFPRYHFIFLIDIILCAHFLLFFLCINILFSFLLLINFSAYFFFFYVQPPFPSISHSSHIDAYVCCFQNARVVNATLEVVCLILFKMARVTKSSNTNKSLRLVLVSGNHHKSSPSRSLPHFLGFFCTHSTWTAEGTKAS